MPDTPAATVPASFVQLCEVLVLHSETSRFARMYQLLWRLVHEPGLRHDPLDAEMLQAQHMARAVQRDMHKMKAFVRFRKVEDTADPQQKLHVAWFEPAHHIVEAVAPWFARRLTQMRWAILTPRRSAAWDGRQLSFAPGASASEAPPVDAGEALWLTYYQSIFNPARLKLKMMQKEMPRKYWHNLPEARLIAPLATQAEARTEAMVQEPAAVPARRIARVTATPLAAPPERIDSLAQLQAATQRCRQCPIGACATQAVPGQGPVGAKIMFVGEQPGDQEDLQGRPFVGPAGQLFDRALAQLGVAREQAYVTNAVKHFKFGLRGNRRIHKTPSQREAAACQHWLGDEIRLVRPGALVALGATAARALLGRAVPVTAERRCYIASPSPAPAMLQALRLTPAASRPRTPCAWLVAVVLVVLVCAQALGFMHGAVHGMHQGAADHGLVATPAGSADAHADAAHDDHGWIGALFSAHEDADDCRVFDGLGSQFAPLMAVPAGMLVLPSANLLRQLDGGFVARWAALFDARGPPLSH